MPGENATPGSAEETKFQGFQALSGQAWFERRFSRPLTTAEHATLPAHVSTVDPDRLDDVVLDLDAPALEAWLADPAAR